MSDCVFCERIKRDEYDVSGFGAVSFEPLNPVTPGHRLFLPVNHAEDARDMSALGSAVALASRFSWDRVGDFNLITSAGPAATQTIKHLHVHYVPRHAGDGLSLPWTNQNAEPLDSALGRCQVLLQCHRETGHAGGHEAREENRDA